MFTSFRPVKPVDEGGIPIVKWIKILGLLLLATFLCGCVSALQNVFLRGCRGLRNCLHAMNDSLGEYTMIVQQPEDELELGDIDADLQEHYDYFDGLDNRAQQKQPQQPATATAQSHPYPAGWSQSLLNPYREGNDGQGWTPAEARKYHSYGGGPVTALFVKSPSFPNMRLKKETIFSTPMGPGRSLPDIVKCTTLYNKDGNIADSFDEIVGEAAVADLKVFYQLCFYF